MKIAIFGNICQDQRLSEISIVMRAVAQTGAQVDVESNFYKYLIARLDPQDIIGSPAILCPPADIVLSIGGDGTFLRAAAWVGRREIPILGINTGRLGYLSDARADDTHRLLSDFAQEKGRSERRSLLKINSSNVFSSRYALNEVAIMKNDSSSMLSIDMEVNGKFVNTYMGDGLIVATPTGSTAYNLSVGGPILHPECRCIVVSPVAAHSLTMRPLVLPDNAEITITPHTDRASAFRLAVDGNSSTLPIGTPLRISKADHSVRVALAAQHDFADALRSKLMWGADSR